MPIPLVKMKHILVSWMQAVPVQRVISTEPGGVLFYPYTGLKDPLGDLPQKRKAVV